VEDTHLRLLRLLETKPNLSQRALARELGISLGKINYCLNALVEKGWVKVKNFRNSDNKLGYVYLVTPRGIESKATITVRFLRHKLDEYEQLKREIALLQREVAERPGRER
jgi:EPS-associated MarR family transcriptional regulator